MPRKPDVPPIPDKPSGRTKPEPSGVDPRPRPGAAQLDLWAAFADGWEGGEPVAVPEASARKPGRRRTRAKG